MLSSSSSGDYCHQSEMPLSSTAEEIITNELFDVLKNVDVQISNPGAFCSASTENALGLSQLMRSLFKSSTELSTKTFGPFQELLVEGFDGETIWEELQTRNRPLTRFVKSKIAGISESVTRTNKAKGNAIKQSRKAMEKAMVKEEDTEDEEDLESEQEGEEDEEKDEDDDDDEEEEEEDDDDMDDNEGIDLDIDDDDEEGDDEEYEGGGDASYDNIDDMQAWLDKQEDLEEKHEKKLERLEKLAAQKGAVEEGPDSDDEEDDMLFVERQMYDDHESEGSDNEDDSKKKKKKGNNMRGSEIKYEDFFRGDMPTKGDKSEKKGNAVEAKSSSGKKSDGKSNSSSKPLKASTASSSKISKSSKSKTVVEEDDYEDDEGDEGDEEEEGEEDEEDDEEGEGFEGEDDEDDSEGDFDETGGDDYDFGDDDEEEAPKAVRTRGLTTHEKRELQMAAQIKEIEG